MSVSNEALPTLGTGNFYGTTRSREARGATFSTVFHPAARDIPEHRHSAPYFCLLLDGGYEETSRGETLTYVPLTIAFHPAALSHHDSIGPDGARFFMIELGPEWNDALPDWPARVSELDGGDPVWSALRLFQLFGEPAFENEPEVDSLLFELCGHVEKMQPPDATEPDWLAAAVERIQAVYPERIDLRRLAAWAGVTPVHLTRCFRRFHGRGVGDYVQGLRVRDVCRHLSESDATATEIAQTLGFADHSHLTRVFKRITGVTPAVYRARLGGSRAAGRT